MTTQPNRIDPDELSKLREGLASPKLGPWANAAITRVFAHIDSLQGEIDDHNRAIVDHGDDELPLDEIPEDAWVEELGNEEPTKSEEEMME